MALIEQMDLESFIRLTADLSSIPIGELLLSSVPVTDMVLESCFSDTLNLESGIYLEEG